MGASVIAAPAQFDAGGRLGVPERSAQPEKYPREPRPQANRQSPSPARRLNRTVQARHAMPTVTGDPAHNLPLLDAKSRRSLIRPPAID